MAFENLKSTGIKYLLNKLKNTFLQIKDAVRTVNGNEPDEFGNINVTTVPYAENLVSDNTQTSHGTYIARTSGGSASIESVGDAWLMNIKGNRVHNDFVAEELYVSNKPDSLEVTIDHDTFVAYVLASDDITFTFTTEWDKNLTTYGITYTGTPVSGDVIVVHYVKEQRGIIYQSAPSTFRSTRWNLFNYSNGYARVIRYSNDCYFRIEGTYTGLYYSATVSGARYELTVNDGNFDPFANNDLTEAYVWVIGGNSSNTEIYMTWTDWTEEANGGVFEAYSDDTINLSSLFDGEDCPLPYGLCSVGSVCDEVSFNLGTATRRVDRMEYNSENLATAKASGREYEYDTNYIYIALAEPITKTIEIDGSFVADDHGMEIFEDTDAPVTVLILYGNNLKNKLERDVLTISQQTLNADQKAQVWQNLGITAPDIPDISKLIVTEVVSCPAFSMTSGTIGTYWKDVSVSISKSGYTCIGATMSTYGDTYCNVMVRVTSSSIVFEIFRAVSSAQSVSAGRYKARIIWARNDIL